MLPHKAVSVSEYWVTRARADAVREAKARKVTEEKLLFANTNMNTMSRYEFVDLCTESCPVLDSHGCNEEAVAEASDATCIHTLSNSRYKWCSTVGQSMGGKADYGFKLSVSHLVIPML